jgi:hypothetical protein
VSAPEFGPVEVVITTPEFRRGQLAAREDARRESEGPNDALLDRLDPEFAAGYRYEWREYIAPIRALLD